MLREGPLNISILTTGGTIEKQYDELDGTLENAASPLQAILKGLRTHDLNVRHVPVMSKDSSEMTDADRNVILDAVRFALHSADGIVVVHGTDTLSVTGEHLHAQLERLEKPVVLTGAMRPFEFRDTDAFQNLTEALLACRMIPPGVYAVMHNQILRFPGIVKDRQRATFVRT